MMLNDSTDLLYQTLSSFLMLTFFAQEVQVVLRSCLESNHTAAR